MCETQKDDPEQDELSKKKPDRRSYYYDDAHGYEDYDPEEENEDDEVEGSA